MDNLRQSGTKSSSGFVYFTKDGDTPPPKKECLDFIGFSDTEKNISDSPQKNRFNPQNFSSPQGGRGRGSPRGFISPKFNNQQRWQHNRYSGGNSNSSFSPNSNQNGSWNNSSTGYNSSRNNSWQGNTYSRGTGRNFNQRQSHTNTDEKFDSKRFLHPSFTEDPWFELEKQLKQRKEQERLKKEQENSNSET